MMNAISMSRLDGAVAFLMRSVLLLLAAAPTGIHGLSFQYTPLEVNSMMCQFPEQDISIVIDPLASQLDFGIPSVYRANKKVLSREETLECIVNAKPSHCLLTQGLDDHTHPPTLDALSKLLPDLQYICAPSAYEKAKSIINFSCKNIQTLAPGQSMKLKSATLTATTGALVGPPWQARENGWLLELDGKRIYMEPHSDVLDETLEALSSDVVIAPVEQQSLLGFNLVEGPKRTVEICNQLGASTLIPLNNGDISPSGWLAELVEASGGMATAQSLASPSLKVVTEQHPGAATTVTI